eukprot:CAMPEP_0184498806 /NCGR_PEP_ID=MMETSP0113_2-20130426/39901_1 /TAXON_ID=91329 /ORGANISM="Norrisiella sphaerica, Strain BC52" /LENGTH=845 /DNA_ID=CAMNT_0026886467 /DNA_START=318 /DNA_END=2855 /DNA_ORIENTATION=+
METEEDLNRALRVEFGADLISFNRSEVSKANLYDSGDPMVIEREMVRLREEARVEVAKKQVADATLSWPQGADGSAQYQDPLLPRPHSMTLAPGSAAIVKPHSPFTSSVPRTHLRNVSVSHFFHRERGSHSISSVKKSGNTVASAEKEASSPSTSDEGDEDPDRGYGLKDHRLMAKALSEYLQTQAGREQSPDYELCPVLPFHTFATGRCEHRANKGELVKYHLRDNGFDIAFSSPQSRLSVYRKSLKKQLPYVHGQDSRTAEEGSIGPAVTSSNLLLNASRPNTVWQQETRAIRRTFVGDLQRKSDRHASSNAWTRIVASETAIATLNRQWLCTITSGPLSFIFSAFLKDQEGNQKTSKDDVRVTYSNSNGSMNDQDNNKKFNNQVNDNDSTDAYAKDQKQSQNDLKAASGGHAINQSLPLTLLVEKMEEGIGQNYDRTLRDFTPASSWQSASRLLLLRAAQLRTLRHAVLCSRHDLYEKKTISIPHLLPDPAFSQSYGDVGALKEGMRIGMGRGESVGNPFAMSETGRPEKYAISHLDVASWLVFLRQLHQLLTRYIGNSSLSAHEKYKSSLLHALASADLDAHSRLFVCVVAILKLAEPEITRTEMFAAARYALSLAHGFHFATQIRASKSFQLRGQVDYEIQESASEVARKDEGCSWHMHLESEWRTFEPIRDMARLRLLRGFIEGFDDPAGNYASAYAGNERKMNPPKSHKQRTSLSDLSAMRQFSLLEEVAARLEDWLHASCERQLLRPDYRRQLNRLCWYFSRAKGGREVRSHLIKHVLSVERLLDMTWDGSLLFYTSHNPKSENSKGKYGREEAECSTKTRQMALKTAQKLAILTDI